MFSGLMQALTWTILCYYFPEQNMSKYHYAWESSFYEYFSSQALVIFLKISELKKYT